MLWAPSKNKRISALLLGLGRGGAVVYVELWCYCFPGAAASATSTSSGMAAALSQEHVAQLSIGRPITALHPGCGLRLTALFGSKHGRGDCKGRRPHEERERNVRAR